MKAATTFQMALCVLLTTALHSAESTTGRVLQVIDGDTRQLDNDRKVRYLGIDAPEKGDPGDEEATQSHNKLVGGKRIRLEFGRPRRDDNGRLLAYVFVGDTLVNEELLRQGQAYVRRPIIAK